MTDLPEPTPERLPGGAPSPEVLEAVVTAGRRRKRRAMVAGGAAACAVVVAVVLTAALTGGGREALTIQPADSPTPEVTVTTTATGTATPEPTTQPSESSQPTTGSVATNAPAGSDVTLSAVGPLVSGQQGILRVHVATADTWTAYILSFNSDGPPLTLQRLFWSGNQPVVGVGDVDRQDVFDVCTAHGNVTRPTDQSSAFPFTPLAAGHFHAVIQVLHGSCNTESPGVALFHQNDPNVVTATLDFTVTDSGWAFDANGPEAPGAQIGFERYRYDSNGPFLMPEGSSTPGFEFTANDQDGDVGAVTVDWGDGTAPEDIRSADVPGCYAGGVSGSMVYVPSRCIYQPDHTYAAPGHYSITLTVHSGTGTRNPQMTSVTKEWVQEDSTPTPSPTPS